MTFFNELKRRNVFRVGIAYLIAAWLILQVVDVLQDILTLPEWAGKLILTLLIVGLPLALIFAWAFELTPDGIKRESELDRAAPIRPKTGIKLDRIIIGVLIVALAYIGIDKLVLEPSQDADLVEATRQAVVAQEGVEQSVESVAVEGIDPSIAVLPFVNMSSDPEQEYFSDGISEELLNLLAKIPELRVISRTSAFSFKGKNLKASEVAQELGVAHILEGSVRKAGNQVRITAQLIQADSDTHLWSETYDRTLENIFAIQDEIAETVVLQLKIKLLGTDPTVEATDTAAYSLYLRARYKHHQLTPDALEQSIALYKEALKVNSRYVAAWTGLAGAYSLSRYSESNKRSTTFERSRDAANKALEINPASAPAHAALGAVAVAFDRDLAAAARHFQRALELEPTNPEVLEPAIEMARSLDRSSDAIAIGEYLRIIDPVSPLIASGLGWSYLNAGYLDEAIASFQSTLNLSPEFVYSHMGIGWALLLRDEPEPALASMQLEPAESVRLSGLALAYHALGEENKSNAALTKLIDGYGQTQHMRIAWVLAYRGEADRSFEWLNRAAEEVDLVMPLYIVSKAFDKLHDDPRWLPFLDRIGMAPHQLDAIEFNVMLPE